MSIVEKALQKAQQTSAAEKAKQGAARMSRRPPRASSHRWRATRLRAPSRDRNRPCPLRRAAHPRGSPSSSIPPGCGSSACFPRRTWFRRRIDEFRRIKWPLLESALGRAAGGSVAAENNLILITSAMAEEGKSFTALNLAGVIGRERDCRCILVDADLRSPKLSQALGLEDRKGIQDLLADESLTLATSSTRPTSRACCSCPPAPAAKADRNCWRAGA
jgi:Mrp family chromosome partitioning ATPase